MAIQHSRVSLPNDGEADNAQRRGELEEALDHAGEVVCTTDGVTLGDDWLNREQAQEDDGERCLSWDLAGQ